MVTLKELKKAYAKAVSKKVHTFFIDGHELVVGYAKYMIEYLDGLSNVSDDTEIDLVPTVAGVQK